MNFPKGHYEEQVGYNPPEHMFLLYSSANKDYRGDV